MILISERLILTVADVLPKNCKWVSYRLISDTNFRKVKLLAKDIRKNRAILRPVIKRKLNHLKFADVSELVTTGMENFPYATEMTCTSHLTKGMYGYGCDFSEREDKTKVYSPFLSQIYLGRIVEDVVDEELFGGSL